MWSVIKSEGNEGAFIMSSHKKEKTYTSMTLLDHFPIPVEANEVLEIACRKQADMMGQSPTADIHRSIEAGTVSSDIPRSGGHLPEPAAVPALSIETISTSDNTDTLDSLSATVTLNKRSPFHLAESYKHNDQPTAETLDHLTDSETDSMPSLIESYLSPYESSDHIIGDVIDNVESLAINGPVTSPNGDSPYDYLSSCEATTEVFAHEPPSQNQSLVVFNTSQRAAESLTSENEEADMCSVNRKACIPNKEETAPVLSVVSSDQKSRVDQRIKKKKFQIAAVFGASSFPPDTADTDTLPKQTTKKYATENSTADSFPNQVADSFPNQVADSFPDQVAEGRSEIPQQAAIKVNEDVSNICSQENTAPEEAQGTAESPVMKPTYTSTKSWSSRKPAPLQSSQIQTLPTALVPSPDKSMCSKLSILDQISHAQKQVRLLRETLLNKEEETDLVPLDDEKSRLIKRVLNASIRHRSVSFWNKQYQEQLEKFADGKKYNDYFKLRELKAEEERLKLQLELFS